MNRALSRRGLLAGATVLPCFMRPALAAPASLPQQPSVMVAGPAASALGRWAEVIAPALGQSMGGGDALGLEMVGGADGVTGVNQFQARVTPDGATALLLPGAALLAWLVGDSRVRFDAGSWATLWGASGTAVVASRGGDRAGQDGAAGRGERRGAGVAGVAGAASDGGGGRAGGDDARGSVVSARRGRGLCARRFGAGEFDAGGVDSAVLFGCGDERAGGRVADGVEFVRE